jgi:Phosphotransferase enzyme family
MEPRPRPWSIVLTIPTPEGSYYFKTTAPEMANDAALTDLLSREAPDLVLAPIALDLDRRWMLLPDGGPRLRDVLAETADLGHWERILPAYAQLQLSLEGRESQLLAAGTLDRRPQRMPDLFDQVLDDGEWLMLGEPDGLTDDQLDRLRALSPRYAQACAELEAAAVGSSIQHDDLHDGNVLAGGRGYRVIDWGDSGVAHPFATLLVTLRSVGNAFELGDWTPFLPAAPELERLRDAYLEPWSDRLPRAELVRLVRVASWTGMLARALIWTLGMRHATDAELTEWHSAVPAWLTELLNNAPA